MTYPEMRAVLQWVVTTDGYFSGLDALSDAQRRWSVALHDPVVGRTIHIGAFELFAQQAPYFLQRPRPAPLHFWAGEDADLRLAHVLHILKHVEAAYPRWAVHSLFENQRGRYQVTLVDTRQVGGVHMITTPAAFERVFAA